MPGELVLLALRHVWKTLEPLNLPVALIGGLALAAWKHVRATRDIDLLLGIGGDRFDPILRQLIAAGMRPKRMPPATAVGRFEIVQLLYEPADAMMELQIDVLLADSEYLGARSSSCHRAARSRHRDCGFDV